MKGIVNKRAGMTTPFMWGALVLCILLLTGCGATVVPETSRDCWTCALYKTVLESIDIFSTRTITMLIKPAQQVLGVGILFYVLFKIAQLLISIKQPNLAKFYISTGTVLFKALLVGAILWVPADQDPAKPVPYVELVGQHVVEPVMTLFFVTSDAILGASSGEVTDRLYIPENMLEAELSQISESPLFGKIPVIMQEIIYRMFVGLSVGMNAGSWFFTMGSFVGTVAGLIITVSFFMMLIIFPMAFIESFVRLGIILVISPFVFVAWVFPMTQGYMKKLWNALFSCLFNLLFSCIFLSFYIYVLFEYDAKFMPYDMLNAHIYNTNVAYRNDALSFAVGPLSFFILLLAMNKMYDSLVDLASYFGGDGQKSGFKRAFEGVKNFTVGAAKAATGAALMGVSGGAVGSGMVQSGAKDMSQTATAGLGNVIGKGESNLGANDSGAGSGESTPVAAPTSGGDEG